MGEYEGKWKGVVELGIPKQNNADTRGNVDFAVSIFVKQMADGFFRIDDANQIWRLKKKVGGRKGRIVSIIPCRAENILPNHYLQLQFSISGERYVVNAHDLIYVLKYGSIPASSIVHHKNGIKSDNRIENLELMTHHQHNLFHARFRIIKYDEPILDSCRKPHLKTRIIPYNRKIWQKGLSTKILKVKEWHEKTVKSKHKNYLKRIEHTIELLHTGLTQNDVAMRLGVSRRTVCQHVHDYYEGGDVKCP